MVVKNGRQWTEDICKLEKTAYITPMLQHNKNYKLDNVLCTKSGIAIFVLEEVKTNESH